MTKDEALARAAKYPRWAAQLGATITALAMLDEAKKLEAIAKTLDGDDTRKMPRSEPGQIR